MNKHLDDLVVELNDSELNLISELECMNDLRIVKLSRLADNYDDLKHVYNSIFDTMINSFYYDKYNNAYDKIKISMNKALIGVFDYQLRKHYTIHEIIASKILESDDDER